MSRILIGVGLLTVLAGAAGAAGEAEYDFFDLSRYPVGGKLKEGVELYEVKEAGGKPDQYERRVVQWWPRKGVDVIEIQKDMPLREWTRIPDVLEEENKLDAEPTIEVRDHLRFDPTRENGAPVPNFIRRIRGYLHPPEDDNYRVMVSADTMGFLFVSPDENPRNKVLVASLTAYSRNWQFDKYPTQISEPIPMKKGKKYYFEVIHKQAGGGNHVEAQWEGDKMPRGNVGPDHISTLDGEPGKIKGEWWRTKDAGAVRAMDLPRTFRAHLIGFDGAGNDVGFPDPKKDFAPPHVILLMADGTRRAVSAGDLCRADQEFTVDIYRREMKRVRATLDKTVYTVNPGTLRAFPGGTPAGEPGSWLKQSEHMAVPSGSQGNSDWINLENPETGNLYRDAVFGNYENMHAYLEYGGHLMPYWDRKEQYKYEGRTGGTIKNGYEKVGSGPGGGYGGQGLIPGPDAPGGGFAHEYGHGYSLQWNSGQSGEILATANADIVGGTITSDNSLQRPWRNCLHGSYNTTLFFRFIGIDPNWGLCAMAALPAAKDELNFFQVLARVGQQRGIFKDGIRGVGDMVGDYGARFAEFDYLWQESMRMTYYAGARNYLEPVDKDKGVYRIPWDEAPEPFGVNIIRLVPVAGNPAIEVDFQGYHDPAVYSDWRACLVAVDKDGKARYSDLWNKGVMRMDRRPGDQRYWLTVAATPSALMQRSVATTYQGHFAVRYPWQVTLWGAEPGTPRFLRNDLDDVYCAYGPKLRNGTVLPAIPNNDQVKGFFEKARTFHDEMKGRMKNAKTQLDEINYLQMVGRAKGMLSAVDGAPHSNGGGWVVAGAEVAPTAYVGPHALVLGRANVRDHAIIEDYAVLMDTVKVSGHARVSGQAVLEDAVKLGGYQRIWHPMRQGADEETPELTPRDGYFTDKDGLWANYAMDQAETVVLEDYYRGKDSSGLAFFSLPNGYLYGDPTFVIDGTHRGFAFDGKTQYAELNRRATDLGELTVDMTVKWQDSGRQVLLDCGSGMDNRFTLALGGSDGKLAFTAVVDGASVAKVASSEPVEKNTWTRVRLEIDGERIALWLNDRKSGETVCAFRAADAFKPGKAQRSFLAAAFNGADKFHGLIDNVVVYHQVHGSGFSKLSPPTRDAPRRPYKGFAKDVYKNMGMSPFARDDMKAQIAGKAGDYWHALAAGALVHLTELKLSVPEYVDAVEKHESFEAWKKRTAAEYQKAYYATNEVAPKQAELDRIGSRIKALDGEIGALAKKQPAKDQPKKAGGKAAPERPQTLTPEVLELQQRAEDLEAKLKKLKAVEDQARTAVAALPESKEAQAEIARLETELKPFGKTEQEKLKAAELADQMLGRIKIATDHIKYAREHDRVLRAYGEARGGLAGGRKAQIREELKARDPEFRKWAELNDRLEQLKREELYRLHDYVLKHTDHPNLLDRGRSKGERTQVESELGGVEKDLRNALRPEAPGTLEVMDKERAVLIQEKETLQAREKELSVEIKNALGPYLDEKMREAGLNEKTTEDEERLKGAAEAVGRRYPIEYHTLCSFMRQNFHGFYNERMMSTIDGHAARLVGGAIRDNLDEVAQIENLYAPENWKTSVDQWDWHTQWEVDGSIKELPLTQKWLKRVRGE